MRYSNNDKYNSSVHCWIIMITTFSSYDVYNCMLYIITLKYNHIILIVILYVTFASKYKYVSTQRTYMRIELFELFDKASVKKSIVLNGSTDREMYVECEDLLQEYE
jgi:hypothetical protein